MACIELQDMVKTHGHTEKQGFGFQPSFRKVNLLPAKLGMFFPLTSPGLRPSQH